MAPTQAATGPGEHFKALVALVNKLQAVCALMGDNAESAENGSGMPGLWDTLPIIVAIGGQSAGKSSVIEAVVGREFLPRGSGICTRRPLVLQLVQCPPSEGETANFLHKKGVLIDISRGADKVREEIEGETSRSLGVGKAVSAEPIMLTIRSPNVPNLTLVDMPGLTKIATDGQPMSIVRELEDMTRAYIKSENVIILAVSPANADIATSDAMRLVREYDSGGERTIGVLTKLDIMDRGTDAREVLEGGSYHLKYGWIGLVNRSQADINAKVNSTNAKQREREFFKQNAKTYGGLRTGTDELITTLTSHLERSILSAVPKINNFLEESIETLEKELLTFGELPSDRSSKMHLVLSLIEAFDTAYKKLLDGGKGGGDRVRNVLEKALPLSIFNLPLAQTFTLRAVYDTIDFADGLQPYLIAPELSMRRLICDGVELLVPPSKAVVDLVHGVLADAVEMTLNEVSRTHPDLERFAMLRGTIGRTALSSLERYREEARFVVVTMVEMEASYFTSSFFRDAQAQANGRALAAKHFGIGAAPREDDYASPQGQGGAVSPYAPSYSRSQMDPDFPPEIEAQLQRVASTVTAYLAGVSDSLVKNIPKAVILKQVKASKTTLLQPLYQKVGGITDEQLVQLLGDDPQTAVRRNDCATRLGHLRKAQQDIKESEFWTASAGSVLDL